MIDPQETSITVDHTNHEVLIYTDKASVVKAIRKRIPNIEVIKEGESHWRIKLPKELWIFFRGPEYLFKIVK